MLIDDDKLVTDLLQKLLKIDGYETVATSDTRKAVALAKEVCPDLFLLDLMMPQPDGFKLCRMLRQSTEFALTPIIIITALDDEDSRAVAFGAGANDYNTKPFHPDDLAERIKELAC